MLYDPSTWKDLETQHIAAAEERTRDHVARRDRGQKHPVYDFLFEYYPLRPSHLARWHPGLGNALADAASSKQAGWRDYLVDPHGVVKADVAGFVARRGQSFVFIRSLLEGSRLNPALFDCFGLHEWAMVYRGGKRHELPLRLSQEETDDVVETHKIKCTHFDAYRFFQPPAKPLNLTVLTREDQPRNDQAGCLHVTMDLYKWAFKLGPLVPGDLLLNAFDLTWDARILDMEASPYDCRDLGVGVVAIETPEGKAEYVRRQRALADRAEPVRRRLLAILDEALSPTKV